MATQKSLIFFLEILLLFSFIDDEDKQIGWSLQNSDFSNRGFHAYKDSILNLF